MSELPRIAHASAVLGARALVVRFEGDPTDWTINLAGWIATGGDVLAPLADGATFAAARVAEHGRAIEWGEDGGDLAIDAAHLKALAEEQASFGPAHLSGWQDAAGLSNTEAAGVLGVSRSTYLAYKSGRPDIPTAIAIACRASQRDPLILQAHYRPAPPAGRPRRAG